jgi:hypothetical protein
MLLLGGVRVIGFSIAASMVLATGAWAQVIFDVNDTGDDIDANVLDGKCETPLPAKKCTLRAAVMQANRMPNAGSIIKLPAGTYKLTIPAPIMDGEENGDLDLIVPAGYSPGPTNIVGDGADVTTIDAQGGSRILKIDFNRTAYISGVALINGNVADDGGGIYNAGSLHLTHSLIMHNIADGYGGGISNQNGTVDVDFSIFSINSARGGGGIFTTGGAVNVVHSTLDSNSTSDSGGAIELEDATVKLDRSTVSRNIATYGGGLETGTGGILVVTSSTISQNKASTNGGGIYSYNGSVRVYNSTIAYNQADSDSDGTGDGAGVMNASATFSLHNSILAGNLRVFDNTYSDCIGVFGFHGGTGLEGALFFYTCVPTQDSTGSLYIVDSASELGILKNNGGPTETIALLPHSGLIGTGPTEECKDDAGHYLTSDQRGNPRPPAGTACDIGAFEYNELFRSSFDPPIP